MPDWQAYVRDRLALPGVLPEDKADVEADIANQLEDAYRDGKARGLSDADATELTTSHIPDWSALASRLAQSRRLARPSARISDENMGGSWGTAVAVIPGLRLLRRHTFFVALATLVLSAAVGINLLVFTIVNALWFRPLPFPGADRVVAIVGSVSSTLSEPRFSLFEGGVAGQVETTDRYVTLRPHLTLGDAGRELEALAVTPSYFSLLQLSVRGRDFVAGDDGIGAEPVSIISDRLWSEAFQRRPDVIGSVVPMRPVPVRVIGVAPAGFQGARRGERADVWIPSNVVRRVAVLPPSGALPLTVLGRLGPSQSLEVIEPRLREMMNPRDREWLLRYEPGWASKPLAVPVSEVFGSPAAKTVVVTEQGAVQIVAALALMVLLGGCTTIAALVLVHYERRRGEFALKVALGANRSRLVADLLRDLVTLAVVGTVGGLSCAVLGLKLLPSLSLPGGVDVTRLDLSLDWRVCAVAVLATLVTLALATAMPIARSTRLRLVGEWSSGGSRPASSERIRQALLATQVGATVVVLVAAGLFVRAVSYGFNAAPGFDVDRTLFVTLRTGDGPSSDTAGVADYRARMAARLEGLRVALSALPGVESVALGAAPVGRETRAPFALTVNAAGVSAQLFFGQLQGGANLLETLDVPILAGRGLTVTDEGQSPVPTVITRALADRLWPNRSPLGEVLVLPEMRLGRQVVVGISADLAFGSLVEPVAGVMTSVSTVSYANTSRFVVRAERPDDVLRSIKRSMAAQVVQAATAREIVAADLGRQRLGAWFFSGFGLVALTIGLGGAFGLVAYLAESRSKELAVRMALGASASQLVTHGMSAALLPVAVGTALGLAGAAAMSKVFAAALVGIGAVDILTYALVSTATLGTAAVATLMAAWRIRRIQPASAMRVT